MDVHHAVLRVQAYSPLGCGALLEHPTVSDIARKHDSQVLGNSAIERERERECVCVCVCVRL